MKKDEPFNPAIKSVELPERVLFRVVEQGDVNAITNLMAERNPNLDEFLLLSKTQSEIDKARTSSNFKIYVAELNDEVVGFCRFLHSSSLPTQKKAYQGPEGWYGMGIMVSSKYRRRNIARFISSSRVNVLKNLGVREFYSIVDSNNLTSMKMHHEFGYVEVARANGFLHLKFNDSAGVLFKLNIS